MLDKWLLTQRIFLALRCNTQKNPFSFYFLSRSHRSIAPIAPMAQARYDAKRGPDLKGWMLTIKADGLPAPAVMEVLKAHARKWVFQQERGEEKDYLHYQCTVNLTKKMRAIQIAKLFGDHWRGVAARPISEGGAEAAWNYSKKTDTRVAGPWSSDPAEKPEPEDCSIIGRSPYPWQQSVKEFVTAERDSKMARSVVYIWDPRGGCGKSSLYKHLRYHKLAGVIKAADSKSMQRQAYQEHKRNGFEAWCMDVPRAGLCSKTAKSFWEGVELIKNGDYQDDRYDSASTLVANPKVVVFSNAEPELKYLSDDRWIVYCVFENRLVEYTPKRAETLKRKTAEAVEAERAEKRQRVLETVPGLDE